MAEKIAGGCVEDFRRHRAQLRRSETIMKPMDTGLAYWKNRALVYEKLYFSAESDLRLCHRRSAPVFAVAIASVIVAMFWIMVYEILK